MYPLVIDWVQDAARAQLRRRIRERKRNTGFWVRGRVAGWRRKLSEAYDAGQAWIVVSLIGEYEYELKGWIKVKNFNLA